MTEPELSVMQRLEALEKTVIELRKLIDHNAAERQKSEALVANRLEDLGKVIG